MIQIEFHALQSRSGKVDGPGERPLLSIALGGAPSADERHIYLPTDIFTVLYNKRTESIIAGVFRP